MSGTYNKAILIGRLGRDPELRYTQNGTPVTQLSLATNEAYTDREGNRQERTEWHRVVVWNKQAENAARHLAKAVWCSSRARCRREAFRTSTEWTAMSQRSRPRVWCSCRTAKDPQFLLPRTRTRLR